MKDTNDLAVATADCASRNPLIAGNRRVSLPVRELVAAIRRHAFDPDLTVSLLRARCRIRDNNVSSRFKHEMGISIKRYLIALRLEAAREMLRHGDRCATEVAYEVGFLYPQTFYRAYRARFGEAPGRLRRAESADLESIA